VRRVGWPDVQASVATLGTWYVVVIVLGGLRFAARAQAWTVCAQPENLPFSEAFRAALVGDAIGNLTPLGLLASEPTKVLLVRERLPVVNAVASVAAENAFYVASVLVMITAGALAFVSAARMPPMLAGVARVTLVAAVAGGFIALWLMRRQPAVLTRLANALATLTGRRATSADRLREIEIHFYALLKWPAARIVRVLLWEALFHLGAVAEVFLVLRVISSGASLIEAFILETTGRLIVVVFKFVPYRLGVDEAGAALVARALTLDPTVGVTLALVRRIRILVWNGVGLLLLVARRR
jgi:glycosyltransferase 2 family protein